MTLILKIVLHVTIVLLSTGSTIIFEAELFMVLPSLGILIKKRNGGKLVAEKKS